MFILDVSVGVSVRFYVGDWFHLLYYFSFWTYVLYVVYFVVVELELAGGASAWLARHNCIWSVVLCPRAAGSRGLGPRRPAASLHADKAFLVVLETPRLKPLRFWALGCMHWLMWTVTRFRFLSWSEAASPGALLPRRRARVYIFRCVTHTFARELQIRDRYVRHTVRGVVPRRGMYLHLLWNRRRYRSLDSNVTNHLPLPLNSINFCTRSECAMHGFFFQAAVYLVSNA